MSYHATVRRTIAVLEPGMLVPVARAVGPGGLVAIGGDLRPDTLLDAYAKGIFPWYESGPILWFCPERRMVLNLQDLRTGRRLRRTIRSGRFGVRLDTAFGEVVGACAGVKRPGQRGTWINPEMIRAYVLLHRLGYAHSAESYLGGRLVGGLYGLALGAVFFGESMFALQDDASKVAFVLLAEQIQRWGFKIIDCQVYTDHMARFGAREQRRDDFLKALREALRQPTRRGRWGLGAGLAGRGLKKNWTLPSARNGGSRSRPFTASSCTTTITRPWISWSWFWRRSSTRARPRLTVS